MGAWNESLWLGHGYYVKCCPAQRIDLLIFMFHHSYLLLQLLRPDHPRDRFCFVLCASCCVGVVSVISCITDDRRPIHENAAPKCNQTIRPTRSVRPNKPKQCAPRRQVSLYKGNSGYISMTVERPTRLATHLARTPKDLVVHKHLVGDDHDP